MPARATRRVWNHSLHLSFPQVDWNLYGWVCFNHRSAVIKALDKPMQPAAIKKRVKFLFPDIRMSANNVRDIIRLFLDRRVLEIARGGSGHHPKYRLTPSGRDLQLLLCRAQHLDKYHVPLRRLSESPGSSTDQRNIEGGLFRTIH